MDFDQTSELALDSIPVFQFHFDGRRYFQSGDLFPACASVTSAQSSASGTRFTIPSRTARGPVADGDDLRYGWL